MAADYWSQAQIDPAYLAQHGANAKALKDLILNYGSSSALDPGLAGQYGIGQSDVSAADSNPYSVQAQLAKTLSGDQYGIQNNANAHGALISGAHEAQQLHEVDNAGQRNYNAQQALQNAIGGITANDTAALTGAYGTITTNALNTPVPATPDPAAAAPAVGGAPALPPISSIGSSNYTGDPRTGTSLYAPIKAPKIPVLKTGLQGHL